MNATAVSSLPVATAPAAALATYGKTFHWASRVLGTRMARHTRAFYALCRYADDLADVVRGSAARRHFAALAEDLDRGTSSTPAVRSFLDVMDEIDVDIRPVLTLVATVERDLEPARFESLDELLRYAYGVAGTVGLVMCDLFEVEDPRARPFAIDLGVAMQLTNIARDVLEDARQDRVYLPAELLGRTVAPDEIVADEGDARSRAYRTVIRLLDLAHDYYRSAERGMRWLPWRARAAVLTASRCYEAIGDVVRSDPRGYWQRRAFVGRLGKVRHTLGGFPRLLLDPNMLGVAPAPEHDPLLHRSLRNLPGVDPRA